MKAELLLAHLPNQLSLLSQTAHNNNLNDRRRVLAPRTSEEEALFIARKYFENKTILEAKLANAVNGGRFLRQNMLDVVANELSAKFNVANRNRKYVEQKLRDMKKEARKYLNMAKGIKVENGEIVRAIPRTPPEPIRLMMEAMIEDHLTFNQNESTNWAELDFSDTTSKHDGSEPEDEDNAKSPANTTAESVASTSSSSSFDLGSTQHNAVLGIDTILGAYFGQPMLAAMASFNSQPQQLETKTTEINSSSKKDNYHEQQSEETENKDTNGGDKIMQVPTGNKVLTSSRHARMCGKSMRRTKFLLNNRNRPIKMNESAKQATESFKKLCDSLLETIPKAAKSFEEVCKLQSEYFQLQINMASFASQLQQINGFHR